MEAISWLPIFFYCFPTSTDQILVDETSEAPISETKDENKKFILQENISGEAFLQIFQKQLQCNVQKIEKKKWTESEDALLIERRSQGKTWVQISKYFLETNPQICKRRYTRLVQNERKWPKSVDLLIKNHYENLGSSWKEIQSLILENNSPDFTSFSTKRLKQRYFFHLRDGIEQREWTKEEDLQLIKMIRQQGKKWKELVSQFKGRTQLQLKNRFNGTLKSVERRVDLKIKSMIRQQKRKQENR